MEHDWVLKERINYRELREGRAPDPKRDPVGVDYRSEYICSRCSIIKINGGIIIKGKDYPTVIASTGGFGCLTC